MADLPEHALEADAPVAAPPPEAAHARVAVVGAGFGGIAVAVHLLGAGITDFVLLERADEVGGTWRDNTYPGAACDVPSHVYSFSFAPNPSWPRSFSRQPDILRYLREVADSFGVRPHVRFGSELVDARWNSGELRWHLRLAGGDTLTCDALVLATGGLSEPKIPDIPGLADFPGFPDTVFHSARWNHGFDLTGARVAVVGTGASAIQFVPHIARKVGRLHLFQRTPPWIMPRVDRPLTGLERALFERVPAAQRFARGFDFMLREVTTPGFVRLPSLMRVGEAVARAWLRLQVRDPELRARLTPDYTLGCKRILLSNDFYPALARPNVELVTSALAAVRGSRVVGADGTEREVDAIILGTGFEATNPPVAAIVHGVDGISLARRWTEETSALRGTTVPGFPNMFLVVGPNTGLGNNSMVHIIESQATYIVDSLLTMAAADLCAIEACEWAARRWTAEMDRRMRRTVWVTGGCSSWYQDASGRIPTLLPASPIRFRRETAAVDLTEYYAVPNQPATVSATVSATVPAPAVATVPTTTPAAVSAIAPVDEPVGEPVDDGLAADSS